MARVPKIDEQISYNGTFFVCAGLFGLVTFWAVWDEGITRREWKSYQEDFFKIERKLAHDRTTASKKALEADPKHQAAVADLKKRKDDLRGSQRAAYEKAQADVQKAEFDRFDAQQNLTFAKSTLDETYYYYTLAKHHEKEHPQELVDLTRKHDALNAELGKRTAALTAAEKHKEDKEKILGQFTDPIAALEKQLEVMRKDVAELERLATVADGKTPELVQQNLEDIGRVDRCESCHLGSSRGGFEGVQPRHFASHPFRRTLLGLHPPEKFGCTQCHDGQGRATQKFHAHAPDKNEDPHAHHSHFWETSLLRKRGSFAGFGDDKVKANFVEGNCRKCHPEQTELRSTLSCEGTEECSLPHDPGLNLKCDVPTAPGYAPGPDVKQPVKYCVNEDGRPELVDLAPQQTRGRKIIEEAGCFGCHPIEGYDRPKPAPSLLHVAAKIDPSWMVEWIRNPKALRPKTRMPHFFPEDIAAPGEYPKKALPEKRPDSDADSLMARNDLSKWDRDHQVVAMASFLLSQSTPYQGMRTGKTAGGDARRGEELVKSLGCLGCHVVEAAGISHVNRGSHLDHAPDFADIGAKTNADWIWNWLKNPKTYSPAARMPDLRLHDQEAADIAIYLAAQKKTPKEVPKHEVVRLETDAPNKKMEELEEAARDPLGDAWKRLSPEEKTVARGQWLVKYYGCYGCHLVNRYETMPGIGVALSSFGAKSVEALDYGDYIADHNAQTWESWTYNKLRHPRVYRYDRVDTRMPQFSFTEQEIKDLMVVLKGLRGEERDPITGRAVPLPVHLLSEAGKLREKGRAMIRWYNCYGCHTVDGHTGDIRQVYPGDLASVAPPILQNEGARTQPHWLFAFFKDVKSLRPWLKVRMPTFGFSDEQSTTLVGMFSALDEVDFPYRFYQDIKLEGGRKEVATALFAEFKCQSCHVLGDVKMCGEKPEPGCIRPDEAANKAPNLLMAKDRLRAEWIVKWMENPEALMPGTRMPSFFPEGANQLKDMMNIPETRARFQRIDKAAVDEALSSTVTQRELLRDYLMTLQPARAAATAGARPAKGKGKEAAVAPVPGKRAQVAPRPPL